MRNGGDALDDDYDEDFNSVPQDEDEEDDEIPVKRVPAVRPAKFQSKAIGIMSSSNGLEGSSSSLTSEATTTVNRKPVQNVIGKKGGTAAAAARIGVVRKAMSSTLNGSFRLRMYSNKLRLCCIGLDY